jgi:hypothetical protein
MLPIHEHKLSPSASSSSAIAQSQKSQARWKLATTRAANGSAYYPFFRACVTREKNNTFPGEEEEKEEDTTQAVVILTKRERGERITRGCAHNSFLHQALMAPRHVCSSSRSGPRLPSWIRWNPPPAHQSLPRLLQ